MKVQEVLPLAFIVLLQKTIVAFVVPSSSFPVKSFPTVAIDYSHKSPTNSLICLYNEHEVEQSSRATITEKPADTIDVLSKTSGESDCDYQKADEEEETIDLNFFGNSPLIIKKSVASSLGLLLLSQGLLFIGVGAVIPSIPLYGKELGFSSTVNGLVISTPAVALLLGAKWAGNFADRARIPAMMYGMALIALSDLGTALANGIPVLLLARLGLGAGRCISEAGERGMLADLANQIPTLRGRALALQQAIVAAGIAIGAPLGGIVVEQYGPRAAFLCVTGAALVALGIYSFLPETVVQRDGTKSNMTNEKEESNVAPSSIEKGEWRKLLSLPQWRGLAICQCGTSFGFAAKMACIPILAAATLPGGAAGAGALVSIAGLSGLVGAPVGGWLTDRAGPSLAAILSGGFSAISLLLIPLVLRLFDSGQETTMLLLNHLTIPLGPQALGFSSLVVAWSIGVAAQGPALTALAQRMAPPGAEATSMALPRAVGDGTYIVAPFLLGIVADSISGIPGIDCAFAGAATLIGAISLSILTREKRS